MIWSRVLVSAIVLARDSSLFNPHIEYLLQRPRLITVLRIESRFGSPVILCSFSIQHEFDKNCGGKDPSYLSVIALLCVRIAVLPYMPCQTETPANVVQCDFPASAPGVITPFPEFQEQLTLDHIFLTFGVFAISRWASNSIDPRFGGQQHFRANQRNRFEDRVHRYI